MSDDFDNVPWPVEDQPAGKVVEGRVVDPAEVEYQRMRARQEAADRLARENAARTPLRVGRRHVSALVAQAVEETAVKHEYGVRGLSTGIPTLDPYVQRAFTPGRVVVNVANTKSGKTALSGNLLLAFAAQGVPVLLGSFEDEQTDTVARWLAGLSAIDVGVIRDGFRRFDGTKMPIPEDFDTAADKLAALGVEVMTEAAAVDQIAAEVGDWVSTTVAACEAPFGVVIIDQLSHIIPTDPAVFAHRWPSAKPPPRSDKKTEVLEWQVEMLQKIARKWNVLVILNHQLNENHAEWERPTERSIRDSRGIVHKADAVIGPWRPSKLPNHAAGQGEPRYIENTEDKAYIIGIVGRAITPFTLEVQWDGATQRFMDLGARRTDPWEAPSAYTAEQAAGITKLAELRARWNADTDAVKDSAAVVAGASLAGRARPRISTPGARRELPPPPVDLTDQSTWRPPQYS